MANGRQPRRCVADSIRYPHDHTDPLPTSDITLHLFPCSSVRHLIGAISTVIQSAGNRGQICLTHNSAQEANVTNNKFLTPEEVADRYRGGISIGTLRNWRTKRIGPSYLKIGKAILYPVDELEEWDRSNRVHCSASERLAKQPSDRG